MSENLRPIPIKQTRVFDAVTVDQNTTSASLPANGIPLNLNENDAGTDGFFTAVITVTSPGTLTIGFDISMDGTNFFKPSTQGSISTATVIAAGFTAILGPDTDGKYTMQITNIPTCNFIRFYATEVNVAAAVLTLDIIRQ